MTLRNSTGKRVNNNEGDLGIMPAQAIFKWPWRLTTRPFAGDDLHVMCLILGSYRIIQLA